MSLLPAEVLVSIFSFLDSVDLKQIALVCSHWKQLSGDDILWRRLSLSRWKIWNKLPDKNETGWKKLFLYREAVVSQFDTSLDKLISPKERHATETKLISHRLDIWEKLLLESSARDSSQPNYWMDLSRRYWASMLLQTINQQFVIEKWTDFISNDDPNKYNIEDGAIWIAQWKKPLLDARAVYATLDSLADQLREHLGINTRQGEELPETATKDLKAFLEQICELFANTLNFKGNIRNYYLDENSYIDAVLQKRVGIPISLSIVFAAICRRIGVKIDMIGIPQHFMVGMRDPVKDCTYFVDCFNARLYDRAGIQNLLQFEIEDVYLQPVSARDVYLRMFRNLLALENVSVWDQYGHMKQFLHIGETVAWRDKFFLANLANSSLGRHQEAIEMLENIKLTHDLPNTNLEYVDREIALIKVKLRSLSDESPDFKKKDATHKFSIGDVVAFYNDELSRVVIGYDLLCVPLTKQMYGGKHDANTRQPYYLTIKLDDSNTIEYLPQSFLQPQSQSNLDNEISLIEDPSVFGLYFDKFDGKKFIPNKHLAFLYPWTTTKEN
jgi:F-box protein 21